jgi:hypothetical protein
VAVVEGVVPVVEGVVPVVEGVVPVVGVELVPVVDGLVAVLDDELIEVLAALVVVGPVPVLPVGSDESVRAHWCILMRTHIDNVSPSTDKDICTSHRRRECHRVRIQHRAHPTRAQTGSCAVQIRTHTTQQQA